MPIQIVNLTGDYVSPTDRQQQAANKHCAVTIDFHFNSSSDKKAKGGEVWYKPNDDLAKNLARDILQGYKNVGLPIHGSNGLEAATTGTRSSFIRHYPCPSVLLEPLFVTNQEQAEWIHNSSNLKSLAQAIADCIKAHFPNAIVGISVGHLYKTSQPNDKGAPCILRDSEADHGKALADEVSARLQNVHLEIDEITE